MGKEAKTNAMRILEREKVPYTAHEYAHEEGVAVAGVDVAGSMGEDPACVYKTLVTQGSSEGLIPRLHQQPDGPDRFVVRPFFITGSRIRALPSLKIP